MNQFLLALCGIPSSGKTHLARVLLQLVQREAQAEIVSTDDWRDEEFYSDFTPENERQVRRDALKKAREILESGISVIHDDTNYYTSMRHELYEIAMERECSFAVVYISTPLETALQWNRERGSPVPDEVIVRISERIDAPGSKYAWDKAIAEVDLASNHADAAAREIVERLYAYARPGARASQVAEPRTSDAILDATTRNVVRSFLEEHPEQMTDTRVSKMRRDILAEARSRGYSVEEAERKLMERLKNLDTHIQ